MKGQNQRTQRQRDRSNIRGGLAPPMPWEGREPLRDWSCLSVSLCFSVLVTGLSPFLIFPEIRNSDWAKIWTRFLSIYWLSCGERRAPTTLRGGDEGQGRALDPCGHPIRRLLLFICRNKANIRKQIVLKVSIQSELWISGNIRNGERA